MACRKHLASDRAHISDNENDFHFMYASTDTDETENNSIFIQNIHQWRKIDMNIFFCLLPNFLFLAIQKHY